MDSSPRLTDPGALLATTHPVGGGLRVRLRLTRPSDRERVREFLEGLSPESRRLRFMAAMPVVGEHLVRHFTFFDPRRRLMVAATAPVDGSEEILGLAEAVASLAAQQGATHLKAELLDENAAMRRLMQRLGPTVRAAEDGSPALYNRRPAGGRRAA